MTSTASLLRNSFPSGTVITDLQDGDVDALFKCIKALSFLDTVVVQNGSVLGEKKDGTIVHASLPDGLSFLDMYCENDRRCFRSSRKLNGKQTTALVELDYEYLFTNGQNEIRVPRCTGTPRLIVLPQFTEDPFVSVGINTRQNKGFSEYLTAKPVDLMLQEDQLLCVRSEGSEGQFFTFDPACYPDVLARRFDAAYRVYDLGLVKGDALTIDLVRESENVWCRATWEFGMGMTITTYEQVIKLLPRYWQIE